MHVPPYEASEKDWEDFFREEDFFENEVDSLDSDDEWLCVVSQHGRLPLQQTDERLAEKAKKQKGPPPGYKFDR
jgi:hypothetical protein